MKISYISVETPGNAVLKQQEFDPASLKPDEVLLQSDYSAVSAGTERAWLLGMPNTAQRFPYYPGYSAAGRVALAGSEVENLKIGDRVLITWGGHRSHTVKKADTVLKIEDDSIDLLDACFAHIASFAFLGVRKLKLELGESAMIAGQGILGAFALQIARLSGGLPVLVSDFDPKRRELALKLGADRAFSPGDPDFVQQVLDATGGNGVDAVVEVTGSAAALQQALEYVAWMGRISLLGCTRISDVPIDFYKYVHCRGVSLIGAHTFTRPQTESCPGMWSEHDDYRTFLKLLAAGRMQVRPLISEVVPPTEAPGIYRTLAETENPPLGIVFDWRKLN